MIKFPNGKLKSGRLYLIMNIDEPYAEAVFEAFRDGEEAKGTWNEPRDFVLWAYTTWGRSGLAYLARNNPCRQIADGAGMLLRSIFIEEDNLHEDAALEKAYFALLDAHDTHVCGSPASRRPPAKADEGGST